MSNDDLFAQPAPDPAFLPETLPVIASEPPPAADPPLVALPAPQPPGPGFWMSALWALVFVVVLNGSVLAVFLAWFVALLLGGGNSQEFVQQAGNPAFQNSPAFLDPITTALAPAMLFGELLSIAFAVLILRLMVGPDWKRQIGLRAPSVVQMLLALMALPAMILLASGVHQLAKSMMPDMGNMDLLVQCFRRWPAWFGVLVVGLGPGLGEELWCRGFLGRGLVGRYGYFGGVLLTSFFFGLMHLSPPHAIATGVLGLLLHLTYLATRSLWVPIMLHALNNGLGVLAAQVEVVSAMDEATNDVPFFVYGAALVLLLTVGYALYRARTRLVDDGTTAYPWTPDYPSIATPPPGSGARLASAAPGWRAGVLVMAAAGAFGASLYLAS